jgi:hypothetical protein
MSPPLFADTMDSLFEECDPEMARAAIPAHLKILEGLLKSDPGNRAILKTLSAGYAGYALLFLEEEEPQRASDLYMRARDYGLKALETSGELLANPGTPGKTVEETLLRIAPEDVDGLFWTTFAWNAWINLNLDKPEGFAALPVSQACLERLLTLDRSFFHGLPMILKGTVLAARPPVLGGDREKARSFFEEAVARDQGRFFPAKYYCARYYAVGAQDRALFRTLLAEIGRGDPRNLREMCLVNTIFRQKAARLLKQEEELFY